MTIEEFLDKQFHLSVTAGMNQRYHQSYSTRWCWIDRGFRIAVGIFTVTGAMLAIAASANASSSLALWSIGIAIISAILGVVLNILPFADWERRSSDLFRRWCDLREDVDALEFELKGNPTAALVARLRQFDGKVHRICGMEEKPDEKRLQQCYDQEEASRHPDKSSPPSPQAVVA